LILQLSNPLTEPFKLVLLQLNELAASLPLPPEISSYAVALILVGVLVKVVTYPLTASQMRSMRGVQALQPELKALQERYKDDREKLAQKQMELYREHGVNPLGGCLPLIIQMVVLFALYGAIMSLANEGVLAGQRFLWIPDLSKCEPNPLCSGAPGALLPGGLPIPILIIAMVASQYAYQMYATPPSTDPQAQAMNSMMKFMPLMFAFFFVSLASGLVLYYTVFNVVGVAQQLLLNRARDAATSGASPPGPARAQANGRAADEALAATTPEQEPASDEPVRSDPRRRRRKKSR
jgi:YidC/Oxa1 family membrane protein insertase